MASEHQQPGRLSGGAGRLWAVARVKRILVNAFLLFHLAAIICWAIPINSPLITAWRLAIRPYFLWSGLFQSWDAFAPAPKRINGYIEAIVIHKDGSIQTWKFPRMERLSLTERYIKERYRKFEENLQAESNARLLPDAARYVARLNNDPSNPSQIIMLVRHWTEIVPREDGSAHAGPPQVQILYEYKVTPEDLK